MIKQRLIGAHVSAAGGVEFAIKRVSEIGGNCVQVFSGSPRVWAKKPIEQHDIKKIYSNQQKFLVDPIFTHAIYLTNLASDKPELRQKSIQSLIYDLKFDAKVRGGGVVVHLGSHQGRGWETVREQVATDIKKILEQTPQESTLLIENSAGQNGKLCSDLSEIKWLLDRVAELWEKVDEKGEITNRLGWCFDTCHGYAAGYYLGEKPPKLIGQEQLLQDDSQSPRCQSALEEINHLGLIKSLRLVHVNDSRDPFASGRDRHANLGEGKIAQSDLVYFLNQAQLTNIPLITEVPGDGQGPDKTNLDRLKSWLK